MREYTQSASAGPASRGHIQLSCMPCHGAPFAATLVSLLSHQALSCHLAAIKLPRPVPVRSPLSGPARSPLSGPARANDARDEGGESSGGGCAGHSGTRCDPTPYLEAGVLDIPGCEEALLREYVPGLTLTLTSEIGVRVDEPIGKSPLVIPGQTTCDPLAFVHGSAELAA